uniref:Uncharacterized protein n=1 Tax=Cajanus cajan TaxID=3821 RepID=A0A151U5I4_CAJCA|nr:hypothetical protein KK1_007229 [Cajanus cajan]
MDQGQSSGISTSNPSIGGTNGFGFDGMISNNPTASFGKRSRPMFEFDVVGNPVVINNALHQQERASTVAVPQILPPFVGELERGFQAPEQSSLFHASQNTLHPELYYQLGSMGPNYAVASPTAVTSLGNGNYNLPTSNFTAQMHGESSSSVQLPQTHESCPQNPLGFANYGAQGSCFPTTQWKNNPNLQQPAESQLSTGLRTLEMMQSGGLISSYSLGGRSSSNSESQSPNTQQQQGPIGNIHHIPYPREMGESSSRNVKMKMTLSDDNQPSTELQMGSLHDATTQGNGNPQPPRPVRYSLYDPMYEQMGFPVDPHLRMFFGRKRRQCKF